MLKNISRLECKIKEKIYQFTCDMDSPLDEVKEAIFQFLKYIGQIEDSIKQHQAQQVEPAQENVIEKINNEEVEVA
jgi:hypothetical protein